MASYTFLSPDRRFGNNMLRGRQISSSDITETATWAQVPVPALPGLEGVVVIDLPAAATSIRIAITDTVFVAQPAQGLILHALQSITLGVAPGDVINVRTV
jgi:hypothetical protein